MKNNPTGNLGEWSEVYVFFSILGDCAIFPCDKTLRRNPDLPALPVRAIHRSDAVEGEITYSLIEGYWEGLNGTVRITPEQGKSEAEQLKNDLLEAKKQANKRRTKEEKDDDSESKQALAFPRAWKFLQLLHSASVKAKSLEKSDIALTIHDSRGAGTIKNGYSIKSYIGKAPTLLNASSLTAFTYEVPEITDSEIELFNSEGRTKIVRNIIEAGYKINWIGMDSQYEENLRNIDEAMPSVMAALLIDNFMARPLPKSQKRNSVKSATEHLTKENPLDLGTRYALKVKRFLVATALGMIPSKAWEGQEDANGGYIIVKPEGDIVTLHIYDRILLSEYLYTHTAFDIPSPKRFDYGRLKRMEDGRVIFQIHLHIRYFYDEN